MLCDKYLNYVKKEAVKLGYIFMLDSGEGRECTKVYKDWDIEDLSGWLIKNEQKKKFLNAQKNNKIDVFNDSYVFVKWNVSETQKLSIEFKKY